MWNWYWDIGEIPVCREFCAYADINITPSKAQLTGERSRTCRVHVKPIDQERNKIACLATNLLKLLTAEVKY